MWMIVPLIGLCLFGVYFYFFARRALTASKLSPRARNAIAIAVAVASVAPSLLFFVGWGVWVMVVLYLGVFCLISDLLAFFWRCAVRKDVKVLRLLYLCGVFPVLLTASLVTYGAVHIYDVKETSYTVYSDKVHESYTVALFTDTHYGLLRNRKDLQAIAASVSGRADIVLLGGDIVDERSSLSDVNEVFEIFGAIRSTYGTYYVYGNHDTASYARNADFTKAQLDEALARNGITALADESVTLGDILLVGRKDRTIARKTPAELLAGADTALFRICLDHSPYELQKDAESGFDLGLFGHTHAGQIFPLGALNVMFDLSGELNYGKASVGKMTAIVSSGVTGWGFPVRTQGNSEYVLVTIAPQG